MSQIESQYDVIIIGSGESGKSAVEALLKQGKTAMLIDLESEMVTTMVCQSPRKPSLHNGQPSSHTAEPIKIGDNESQILLHKQTIETPSSEINTYTFQVEDCSELETVTYYLEDETKNQREETFNNYGYIKDDSDEPEIIEADSLYEVTESIPLLRERENSLREKLIRRKAKFYYTEQPPEQEYELPIYQLERIPIEEVTEQESPWEEKKTSYFSQPSTYQEEEVKPSPYTSSGKEQPVYRERELKLRKRLIGSGRLQIVDTQKAQQVQSEPESPRVFKEEAGLLFPFENNMVNPNQPNQNEIYSDKIKVENKDTETEIYPLEPFSARRRSRAGKKNRLTQPYDANLEKNEKKPIQKSESQFIPAHAISTPEYNGLFEGEYPKIQPFMHNHMEEPTNTEPKPIETQSNDQLKRDNIEFEDAYGGYNSWEEFLTPFSQNSRKRQEIDKIEKRKLALRGLHNLINNLG